MLLFLVEIVLNLHWPLLLAGAALPLACPFMAIPLNLPGMFALVVFLLGFWLWKRLKNPGKSASCGQKKPPEASGGWVRVSWQGCAACSPCPGLWQRLPSRPLYTIPYQVESGGGEGSSPADGRFSGHGGRQRQPGQCVRRRGSFNGYLRKPTAHLHHLPPPILPGRL